MEYTDLIQLNIFKKGIFCGILRRRTDGGAEFIYDASYLQRPVNPPLCFNMKLHSEPFIQYGANLHPYFAGLLPEGLRLKFLTQKVKTSPDDLFSLFSAIGSDCIGDVSTELDSSDKFLNDKSLPSWKEINFYEYFMESVIGKAGFDKSEFAGVQEKVSASMLSLPVTVRNKGSYILKLNPKDKPNLVYNEWACLYLAQQCGIEVNEFHLIEDRDEDQGLLVKRFDRVFMDDELIRVHQEDMCQVLNLFPSEKYRVPLKEIFGALQTYTTSPLVETYGLIRLIVFSYLIGNGDLHAKNISLIESPADGRIKLTPAYDLICTLIYGDQKMALKMDGKNSNFKRNDFINFATRFGLPKKSVETLIDDVLNAFYLHHHILFSIPMSDSRMHFLETDFKNRMEALS